MANNTLTALEGVRVGHSTHPEKLTGCTLVLLDDEYPAAYAGHGGDIISLNTDSLRVGADRRREGFFIAGGSATGLMSVSGIMQAMIADRVGRKTSAIVNPNLSGAVVFDQGTRIAQYDPVYGAEAYQNLSRSPVQNGNVGAGTGTVVGKFHWLENGTVSGGMKTGVGNARIDLDNGVKICALTVLNAIGNVVLADGSILAGNRDEYKRFKKFDETVALVTGDHANTTITVVGTNADLGPRENYARLAELATQGHVRAINPVQTSQDGDTVFVFSTQEIGNPLNGYADYFQGPKQAGFTIDVLGYAAAQAVQNSIYDACYSADSVPFHGAYKGIFPSANDY